MRSSIQGISAMKLTHEGTAFALPDSDVAVEVTSSISLPALARDAEEALGRDMDKLARLAFKGSNDVACMETLQGSWNDQRRLVEE